MNFDDIPRDDLVAALAYAEQLRAEGRYRPEDGTMLLQLQSSTEAQMALLAELPQAGE